MKRRNIHVLAQAVMLLAAAYALVFDAKAQVSRPTITHFDVRAERLVPHDAKLEKIAEGFQWVEGPAWNRADGFLLFTDIPANAVHRWRPGKGTDLFLKPSGYTGTAPFAGREPGANGLTFDRQGRLVLAEHGDRRITRLEANGAKSTLADRFGGKRLNSPNDVVFDARGNLYFTDPPFGLPRAFDDPAKEQSVSGVYRLATDGKLSLLIDDLKAPNGIAFSPDGRVLYVTDVDPARPRWLAYDVRADGSVANGRVFADAREYVKTRKGGPDGLKVDRDGNLFASGPGGLYVFAPEGKLLAMIDLGVPTSNCAWGEDGSVLFITADTAVWRLQTLTKGAGF